MNNVMVFYLYQTVQVQMLVTFLTKLACTFLYD